MKLWFYCLNIATIFFGCGNSIFLTPAVNVKPGQYLIMQKKATIYGQIQNQKRDLHLVILKKGSIFRGEHILGDSTGLFTIQVDSGTYRLYNDKVTAKDLYQAHGTPNAPTVEFPPKCKYLHHEFTVSNRSLAYIGSLFLTDENIDVSFEKDFTDSLMKTKYRNFKADRTTENYPERLPIDSVVCP
jgi:hypothetical protein